MNHVRELECDDLFTQIIIKLEMIKKISLYCYVIFERINTTIYLSRFLYFVLKFCKRAKFSRIKFLNV